MLFQNGEKMTQIVRRNFFSVLAAGASIGAVRAFGVSVEVNDEPTFVLKNGTKEWRNKEGELHRVGGPAIIGTNGLKEWFQNGECHRIGGPAIIRADGTEYWFQNGQYHRADGPALICTNGNIGIRIIS